MKNLIVLTMLAVLTACAGANLREKVFIPHNMLTAWEGVNENIQWGIDATTPANLQAIEQERAEMGAALEAGSIALLRSVDWASLRPVAEAGINSKLAAGDIGTFVSDLLLERVVNFDEAYTLAVMLK